MMKRHAWRIGLAVAAGIAVVAFVLSDLDRVSPGPLSAVHARSAGLPDGGECSSCHGSGAQGMADACVQCHEPIGAQLAEGTGLHGTLPRAEARDCGACHADHHGRAFDVVSALSFREAGYETVEDFDHGMLDFGLEGRHEELQCGDCHPHANVEVLAAGERRYLGLDQDCTTCHDDPHRGLMVRGCAECHGQELPFAEAAEFAHHADFPLEGSHALETCAECHPPGSAHAIERLDGKLARADWRVCSDCHDSPHAGGFEFAAAGWSGLGSGAACEACHPWTHEDFGAATGDFPAGAHGTLTGFALDGPHAGLSCRDCHAATHAGEDAASFAARYPGRDAEDCGACHGDPHGGQFAGQPLAEREGCTGCHDARGFVPSHFDVADHAASDFALEGAHAEVACADCHRPSEDPDRPRVFAGLTQECSSCHADAHDGALSADGRDVADCARCHDPHGFSDEEVRRAFEHARWTDFPLDGRHARIACTACHERSARADATGRTFGRITELVAGDPEACASCHADVHDGAFAADAAPRRVDGREGCARCHDTSAFHDLHTGVFEHGAWTGFALRGAHGQAQCSACHRPDGSGRRLGRVTAHHRGDFGDCATCHADAHGGAFDSPLLPRSVDGRTSCARCHVEISFRHFDAPFDHGKWTGFPLDGAHAAASCTACHPAPGADAPAAGPYAPPPRLGRANGQRCVNCHADPHAGQFAAGPPKVKHCGDCHSPSGGFAPDDFDHARDTRFPLDENHGRLDCGACHRPEAVEDGPPVVRFRPLGRTCEACHGF